MLTYEKEEAIASLNRKIEKLGLGIVDMVRENGGEMTLLAVCHALDPAPSKRLMMAIRLAVERMLARRHLNITPADRISILEEETMEITEDDASGPKRHGLPRLRMEIPDEGRRVIYEAILDVLEKHGGVMRTSEIHDAVPVGVRLGGRQRFVDRLVWMHEQDFIVRIAPGWYCHPAHEEEARRQHAARVDDPPPKVRRAKTLSTKDHIIRILRAQKGDVRPSEILAVLKQEGREISLAGVSFALRELLDAHRILRVTYGRYRAVPVTEDDAPSSGAVPAPEHSTVEPDRATAARGHARPSVREHIVRIMHTRKEDVRPSEILVLLEQEGRGVARVTMTHALRKLVDEERILRVGRGRYRIAETDSA